MKRELILHIGSEKTGTTSLQEFLHMNRKRLGSKGVYFPYKFGLKNHTNLVMFSLNDFKYDHFFLKKGVYNSFQRRLFDDAFLRAFDNEMNDINSSINKVVISSEHFHSRITDVEELVKLKRLLEQYFYKITIVCYLREQSSLAESWYSTVLKSGSIKKNGKSPKFQSFIDEWCKPENHYFNYYKMLSKWESVFGFNSIKVRVFTKGKLIEDCIISDFNHYFLDEGKGLKKPSVKNESLSNLSSKIIAFINAVMPTFTIYAKPRRFLVNLVSKIKFGGPLKIREKKRQEIKMLFFDDNKKLSKKYLNDDREWFNGEK